MIPKIIHYCWFGGNPLPEDAKRYIATWRKFCPDYEIKEWNESNFDINCCDYVREAYEAKKWAFVSDYARFYILYQYGGVYFDTDVEMIRPLFSILQKGPFMGMEVNSPACVAPGLGLAAIPGLKFYREVLDFYENRHFKQKNGKIDDTTIVVYVTNLLKKYGLKNGNKMQLIEGINIYPTEFFCPKNPSTGNLLITENTYTIHHYTASWFSPWQKFRHSVKINITLLFGEKFTQKLKILVKYFSRG